MTPTPISRPQCQCDPTVRGCSVIVAIARDNAIGIDGDQPFFLREDLRRFKELTTGHAIIMGRKTFEALPKGALPGRRNIVVSRREGLSLPGAEVFGSLNQAIEEALKADDEPFVIGGGEIYRHSLDLASRLYVTEIDADVAGADTFFPAIDPKVWQIAEEGPWQYPAGKPGPTASTGAAPEAETQPRFRFLVYTRRGDCPR